MVPARALPPTSYPRTHQITTAMDEEEPLPRNIGKERFYEMSCRKCFLLWMHLFIARADAQAKCKLALLLSLQCCSLLLVVVLYSMAAVKWPSDQPSEAVLLSVALAPFPEPPGNDKRFFHAITTLEHLPLSQQKQYFSMAKARHAGNVDSIMEEVRATLEAVTLKEYDIGTRLASLNNIARWLVGAQLSDTETATFSFLFETITASPQQSDRKDLDLQDDEPILPLPTLTRRPSKLLTLFEEPVEERAAASTSATRAEKKQQLLSKLRSRATVVAEVKRKSVKATAKDKRYDLPRLAAQLGIPTDLLSLALQVRLLLRCHAAGIATALVLHTLTGCPWSAHAAIAVPQPKSSCAIRNKEGFSQKVGG